MNKESTVNLKFLKERRLKLNLSLQTVAEELGFNDASTYYHYENGTYKIKADMLPKLSHIFACDIEDFFN